MKITVENAEDILSKYLRNNQDKYEHSIRVGKVSQILARIYGYSEDDAIIAGLLHDIGKSLSKQQMLELCMRNNIEIYDFELYETAEALHGKISGIIFSKEFDKDEIERFETIYNAIFYHVAGRENMSQLDKIIFVADNIEINRGNDLLKRIESDDIENLNDCIKAIIENKIKKANSLERELNPQLNATLEGLFNESQDTNFYK